MFTLEQRANGLFTGGGGRQGCRTDLAVLGLGRGLLNKSTFRADVSQTTERRNTTGCTSFSYSCRFDMVKALAVDIV